MQRTFFKYLVDSRRRESVLALFLVAATILAYQPAWNGGFLWDDDAYITNNELLTAPDGFGSPSIRRRNTSRLLIRASASSVPFGD
jgi:hypothetical protein